MSKDPYVYDGEIEIVQNYRYKCSRRKMKNNIIMGK